MVSSFSQRNLNLLLTFYSDFFATTIPKPFTPSLPQTYLQENQYDKII